LISIADMGEWWETMTILPVPLGAILVRNDIGDDEAMMLNAAIRRSLAYAREHMGEVMPYVREHAVEMSDEVMKSHIALYVNDFSNDLGREGRVAVHALFARAHDAGILHRQVEPVFAT
jgi:1,4-dihydroxy-6-naphthoate synthase